MCLCMQVNIIYLNQMMCPSALSAEGLCLMCLRLCGSLFPAEEAACHADQNCDACYDGRA